EALPRGVRRHLPAGLRRAWGRGGKRGLRGRRRLTGDRALLRPGGHGRDLRHRPPLGRAHQPRRDRGLRPDPPLPLVPGPRLRRLPAPGGLRRERHPPRPLRGRGQPGRDRPLRLPPAGGAPGAGLDHTAHVRRLGGGHGRAGRGAGGGHSHRRLRGPRRYLRRAHSRGLYEPGALVWPCPARWHLDRPLGVLGWSSGWGRARCRPLPVRAGRESAQARRQGRL
ncbi:MAG: Aquaporin Z, partial [uncultured Rubrobacteraceae bacterium]